MPACLSPAAETTTPLRPDLGELALRVRGPGHEGRIIHVRSPKCTVGSAPGCTLRLREAQVAPLSCWIVRGSQGMVVRRLSGPALLNGRRVDEAALRTGDRLRVGMVELEVVEGPRDEFPPSAAAGAGGPEPGTPASLGELEQALERIRQLESESRQGWQSSIVAAERADQLRDALTAANEQLGEAERELAAQEARLAACTAELSACHTELEAARHARECVTAEWEQSRQELKRVVAARADLEAVVQTLQTQLGGAVAERDALRTELQSLRQHLDSLQPERQRLAEAERNAQQRLDEQSARWQQERAEMARRLELAHEEITALRAGAASQNGVMTIQMDQLQRAADDAGHKRELLAVRVAQLEQQLAERNQEVERLSAAAQQQGDLEQQAQQLANQTADLAAQRGQLEDQAAALARQHETVAELQQTLEREREQHRAAAEALREEHAHCEEQASLVQQQLEAAAARLSEVERLREQVLAEQAALALRSEGLDQREQELLQQQQALAAAQAAASAESVPASSAPPLDDPLAARREELEQQIVAWEARQGELDQRQCELESRLAQLEQRAAELLAWEEALEQQAAALQALPAQVSQPAAAPSLSGSEGGRVPPDGAAAGPAAAAPAVEPLGEAVSPANVTARWQSPEELEQSAARDAGPAASGPASEVDDPSLSQVSDVLGRLMKAGVWRGEQDQHQVPASDAHAGPHEGEVREPGANAGPDGQDVPSEATVPSGTTPAEPHADQTAGNSGGEDESIEAYMDRLLKRVRGESTTNSGGWKQVAPDSPPAEPEAHTPAKTAPPPKVTDTVSPEEYVPRRAAPELTSDLSAMRDLANSAARTAIDRHIRKHTAKQATARVVAACLVVAVSLVLGYVAWRGHSLPAGLGAAIGIGVGIFWMIAALRRVLVVMRLNRPEDEPAATEPNA
jgi:chromosome segregation ATPase